MTGESFLTSRRRRIWLGGILLAALVVRLGWGLSRPVDEAALAALPDQQEYLEIGRNLLDGHGMGFLDRRFGEHVVAFRMPGYPLFVAACGGNVRGIRAAQAVLDTGTVLAVYLLAGLVMGGTAGGLVGARGRGGEGRGDLEGGAGIGPLVAAGIVAINPYLIFFSGLVLSETLFIALLAWGMVLLVAGNGAQTRQPRTLVWLLGGVLLALGVLVRPSAAGIPVMLGIAAAFVNRRRGGAYQGAVVARLRWPLPVGTTMLLLVLLVLTPWVLRNYRVLHEWVLTDTNAGITLYDGYNPDATGASDQRFVKRMPQLRSMGEVGRSQYLQILAIEWAREHADRIPALAWEKVKRTWSPMPLSEQFGRPLYRWAGAAYSVPLDLLVVWAVWRGNLRRSAKVFLLLPAIYLTAVHGLTVGSLRYRLPAEPPMAVVGASVFVASAKWKRAAASAGC
ncbi:MAG: family glycosyltransferase, 4-amino-4-deoxy-L-arabinose transferase [Phycisphaerales bacterium]|nr:family glycosyltransferase, 4-amino-4-deoxy-L-arabinose transferase [Phycisphaerales bacterium]